VIVEIETDPHRIRSTRRATAGGKMGEKPGENIRAVSGIANVAAILCSKASHSGGGKAKAGASVSASPFTRSDGIRCQSAMSRAASKLCHSHRGAEMPEAAMNARRRAGHGGAGDVFHHDRRDRQVGRAGWDCRCRALRNQRFEDPTGWLASIFVGRNIAAGRPPRASACSTASFWRSYLVLGASQRLPRSGQFSAKNLMLEEKEDASAVGKPAHQFNRFATLICRVS